MKGKLVKKTKAWAIETNYTDIDGKYYNSFLGVLRFAPGYPEYADGNRIALIRTRKIGRRYLKEVRFSWPDAKLVRVEVTVKEV